MGLQQPHDPNPSPNPTPTLALALALTPALALALALALTPTPTPTLTKVRLWDYYSQNRYSLMTDLQKTMDGSKLYAGQDLLIECQLADGGWTFDASTCQTNETNTNETAEELPHLEEVAAELQQRALAGLMEGKEDVQEQQQLLQQLQQQLQQQLPAERAAELRAQLQKQLQLQKALDAANSRVAQMERERQILEQKMTREAEKLAVAQAKKEADLKRVLRAELETAKRAWHEERDRLVQAEAGAQEELRTLREESRVMEVERDAALGEASAWEARFSEQNLETSGLLLAATQREAALVHREAALETRLHAAEERCLAAAEAAAARSEELVAAEDAATREHERAALNANDRRARARADEARLESQQPRILSKGEVTQATRGFAQALKQ